ncbi:TrbI/VirB10 family protein [Candidatus Ichthyocystis sparus]|uniref:TrbI/VirB10 family protein n=1 Tax=Candidatus Ichthyocystis sparus TaxID=1561004 RepID=UPI000B823C65|nr:TrbI/VirB10 family protein [Candidatus Ichthyocystis sparus]
MRTSFVRLLSRMVFSLCVFSTIVGYVVRYRLNKRKELLSIQRHLGTISNQIPKFDPVSDLLDKQISGAYAENKSSRNHQHHTSHALKYREAKDNISALMSPLVAYQDNIGGGVVLDDSIPICTLLRGSSIPMVLMMRVISPPDGIVRAQVVANVYDSVSLSRVIIPAGSRFIGRIDRKQSEYSGRILLRFEQFVLPNGNVIEGKDFYSSDSDGSTGNSANVDRHFWQNFAPHFVLAGISTIGTLLSMRTKEVAGYDPRLQTDRYPMSPLSDSIISNVSDRFNKSGKIPITIRLDPGQRFIIINQKTTNFSCPDIS